MSAEITNLDLLVQSAKVVGFNTVDYSFLTTDERESWNHGVQLVDGIGRHTRIWDPLHNGEDAFWLVFKLSLAVEELSAGVRVGRIDRRFEASGGEVTWIVTRGYAAEPCGEIVSKYHAVCAALTRAAALIWQSQGYNSPGVQV